MIRIDGLVQDCSNSIANALELLQSCTKPSMSKISTCLSSMKDFNECIPPVPMFPCPFVHQSQCFPVPMFPVPMFRARDIPPAPRCSNLTHPQKCSRFPMFSKDLIPVKMFAVPKFTRNVSQSLRFTNLFLSTYDPSLYVPHSSLVLFKCSLTVFVNNTNTAR